MVQRFYVLFTSAIFYFLFITTATTTTTTMLTYKKKIECGDWDRFSGICINGAHKSEGRTIWNSISGRYIGKKNIPSLIYNSKTNKLPPFSHPQYANSFLCYNSDPHLNETRYRQEIGIKNTHRDRNIFIKKPLLLYIINICLCTQTGCAEGVWVASFS